MSQSQDHTERLILDDLLASFPAFSGMPLQWRKPRKDPPDFISDTSTPIGIELGEWLKEDQMAAAKWREARSDEVRSLLRANWQTEYQPRNFRGAYLTLRAAKIASQDREEVRKEFYAYAAEVDSSWLVNPERRGQAYQPHTLPATYPLLRKYFSIRFIGGPPHGLCWISTSGDGGPYNPDDTVTALHRLLEKKLQKYSQPASQQHLKSYGLTQFNLLVHSGFNAFAYNTPRGPLSLPEIAARAAQFYSRQPEREIFNHVWVFDSLDSATEINQMLGFPPEGRRSRWLAQIWPSLQIDPRST